MALLYIFIFLLAILLIAAVMLPNAYNVEHVVIIRRAVTEVMDKVTDLRFYAQWSSLKLMDPKWSVEISGVPKTIGHSCSWKKKISGKGNVTIRAIDERHVHFDLNIVPWHVKTRDNWFFEEWGDGETKVILQNNGLFAFPFARLMSWLILKKLHRGISKGLINLKILCEAGNLS